MKAHQKPMTNMQALIQAVYATRPPVLAAIKIDTPPHGLEVIHMEFALTPELIKAWGEQCAEMLERQQSRVNSQTPPFRPPPMDNEYMRKP